ncbi:cAMP-binding protein [Lysinibacillus sp. 2017]|uniref:cAMP-binding protein n=1 Tax=unclassified Lysinibacillus TaxID=2636778 RepID=UPI000D527B8F|nr:MULTISPECIES: cAMP-binding protein [unclassified Lysinibacillus]AWE06946.1 cAMP-binding protein [Lysinibacillus sp. 2017]TGN37128.1 cAMP-binding protein [Lysinibacillus sp. S2017]
MGKNVSKANHGKTGAELISEAFGMSKNDSEALLAQASEVQTTDIPLGKDDVYARDSTTTTLNNLQQDNTSAILDRNGPR